MSDNEWYTPAKYIEAAKQVMGSIDLDPASCALANETVKADTYYSKENNGLELPWFGNVWLNPPFNKEHGKSTAEKWSIRLIESYQTGAIEQAILLAPGQTASKWFQSLWNYPLCFANHHIKFYCPQLQKYKGQRDCTFMAYLGPNEQRFTEIFSQFGTIVKRVA